MEDFTFFDFETRKGAGKAVPDHHFSAYLHSTSAMTLNKEDSMLIRSKGMTNLRIQRNNLTGEIMLVFNKEKGIELKKYRGNCGLTITNKELIKFLFSTFGVTNYEKRYYFEITQNMARVDDYVTFKIIKVESDE